MREILARSRAEVFRFFVSGMPLLTPACFFPENFLLHRFRLNQKNNQTSHEDDFRHRIKTAVVLNCNNRNG